MCMHQRLMMVCGHAQERNRCDNASLLYVYGQTSQTRTQLLFTSQIGLFQRESGLDRVERAGSSGKRQEIWVIDQVLLLRVYGPRRSRGPESRKKRTTPISSHLDRTSSVNKGFIVRLPGKFFLRDTAGSPERAR